MIDPASSAPRSTSSATGSSSASTATPWPPRDEELAATADARWGDQIFSRIGCDVCHVRNIATAPAGTVINQGAFRVPPALGGKVIHPFGDFLLHNVGTGGR